MSLSRGLSWVLAPLHAAALLTGAKSFRDNPILGSPRLNRRGLHVWRKGLACRMAARRRERLAELIDADDRAGFERDGFIVKRDFLPKAEFEALREQALGVAAPARDSRQGDTITRRIPIDAEGERRLPAVARLARSAAYRSLLRYVGASNLRPHVFVQTIFSQVYAVEPDPQTDLHSDTFHPTVKAWLFLTDVAEDEGPFSYVPGSHRPTPERMAWEKSVSIGARDSSSFLTARGSFRVRPEELPGLSLPPPRVFAVPANTLVVADTSGFHGRGRSARPSVRCEVFAYGRRSPFLPWLGFDLSGLPLIKGYAMQLSWAFDDLIQALTRRWAPWQKAGDVTARQPPEILIHFDLEAVRRLEKARALQNG